MLLLSRVLCPPIIGCFSVRWTNRGHGDKKGTLPKVAKCLKSFIYRYFPQQNLYFFPEPQGHGELRFVMVYNLLQSFIITQNP